MLLLNEMKTQHSSTAIIEFLVQHEQALPGTIEQLTEGHISQAYKFETQAGKYVCRLAISRDGFDADQFAFHNFTHLQIPAVNMIGRYDPDTYYCVTDYVEGKTAISLSSDEMEAILPEIQQSLASIYLTYINGSKGYGQIDVTSGNAKHGSWQEKLVQIRKHGRQAFKINATNIEP